MQILKIAFLQNAYFSEFAIMVRNCFFILNSDQKSGNTLQSCQLLFMKDSDNPIT